MNSTSQTCSGVASLKFGEDVDRADLLLLEQRDGLEPLARARLRSLLELGELDGLRLERLDLRLELRVLGDDRRQPHAARHLDHDQQRDHAAAPRASRRVLVSPAGVPLRLANGEEVDPNHGLSPARRDARPTVTANEAALLRTKSASTVRAERDALEGLASSTGVSRRSLSKRGQPLGPRDAAAQIDRRERLFGFRAPVEAERAVDLVDQELDRRGERRLDLLARERARGAAGLRSSASSEETPSVRIRTSLNSAPPTGMSPVNEERPPRRMLIEQ